MKQPSLVPAVAVGKDHVEQEVKTKSTKEQECCDYPPHLVLPGNYLVLFSLLFIIQTAIYILHQINDGLQIEYVLSLRDQIVQ